MDESAVPLPRPGEPSSLSPLAGPVDIGSGRETSMGSAIVSPGGGSFVGPRRQANREIRQLIRQLG